MVLNKQIFKYLKNDNTYLEREPMEKLSNIGQLYAYKHNGFWQCMDTLRDKELLEKVFNKKNILNNKKNFNSRWNRFLRLSSMRFFKKKGWIVHSISKFKPQKKRKITGDKYILCDDSHKKILNKKIDKLYDYTVNPSGYVDHSKNKSIIQSHFVGCKNLIQILKSRGIRKFVQIGSSIEYGNQKSPQVEKKIEKINTLSVYGNAKLSSTMFLKKIFENEGTPITILRLYLVYGPNQDDNRVIPFVINNCIRKK